MSKTEFAESIGLSRAGYTLVESGHRRPPGQALAMLHQHFNVAPSEIMLGEESSPSSDLAPDELEAVGLLRSFSVDERRRAISLLRRLKDLRSQQRPPELAAAERVVQYNEPAPELRPLNLYRVAAGRGVDPLELYDTVENPDPRKYSPSEYFALRVIGDSMTGSGIRDKDIVLVRATMEARKGQIVAIEHRLQQDVVLKEVAKIDAHQVVLHSTNPEYPDLQWDRRRVTVRGVFVRIINAPE